MQFYSFFKMILESEYVLKFVIILSLFIFICFEFLFPFFKTKKIKPIKNSIYLLLPVVAISCLIKNNFFIYPIIILLILFIINILYEGYLERVEREIKFDVVKESLNINFIIITLVSIFLKKEIPIMNFNFIEIMLLILSIIIALTNLKLKYKRLLILIVCLFSNKLLIIIVPFIFITVLKIKNKVTKENDKNFN